MITEQSLTLVGKINKTHGLTGEMSVSFLDERIKDSVAKGSCVILDIDGIFTPFFVSAIRPRNTEAVLMTLDNIGSQEAASPYVGKSVYMLTESVPAAEEEDEDGLYAGQLIGYKAYDTEDKLLGEIFDIDESTENVLFLLHAPDGKTIYIPVVDEFIEEISTDDHRIVFDLPTGLLE